jgi:hypothetical protein
MATLAKTFDDVTCPRCRDRLAACPTNEHGFPLAATSYAVGNVARATGGHQMYFDHEGRVALCAADPLPETSRA